MKNSVEAILLVLFMSVTWINSECFSRNYMNDNEDNETLLVEMKNILMDEFDLWYPLVIDSEQGGFFSDVNYKWELEGSQNKMIVTQSRHIWSVSNLLNQLPGFYPDKNLMLKAGAHGFRFLQEKMWDKEFGGFYDLVDRSGTPLKENNVIIKRAYGNSFAIYALAAYYKCSGDSSALELAKKTFAWLDKNSFDPLYGGYFQFLSKQGVPFKKGFGNAPPKDQNSSIHLLEAFTELYSVWPDVKLKERLSALLHIIRDKITTDKGYMNLFFKQDWTPVSFKNSDEETRRENYEFDHVSFGHDVETAYLMLEASEVLGTENDSLTLRIAKKMVDHALNNGWDNENGGIFDGGYYFGNEKRAAIIKDTKEWWSQAEALNTFLMMADLFPEQKEYYKEKFLQQWEFIKESVIDKEYGGWYWGGLDKDPERKTFHKATIWKGNYHTSRSLINCIKRLSKNEVKSDFYDQPE
jgi:mannobiose 2-epimerase